MRKLINVTMIAIFGLSTIIAGEIKGRVKYIGKPPK